MAEPTADATLLEEAPAALETILDPSSLEEEMALPEPEYDGSVDPRELAPDKRPAPDLSETDLADLGNDLCALLNDHDTAMEERWRRIDRCLDNFDQQVDDKTTGQQPFSARTTSELTKSKCKHAKGRVTGAMLAADPLISIRTLDPEPRDAEKDDPLSPERQAEDAEVFINNYVATELGRPWVDAKNLRAVKTGTGITYDWWETRTKKHWYYDEDGKTQSDSREEGRIVSRFVDHRDFIIWPVLLDNWQEEYEIIGHRSRRLLKWQFASRCRKLGIPESLIEEVVAPTSQLDDEGATDQAKRKGVDLDAMQEDRYELTEVWVHGDIGPLEPDKYRIFLHEPTRRILKVEYNPLYCQLHPYMPVRYERREGYAFGEGIAEDLLHPQAIASTLDNLELDSLRINALDLILTKTDTGADSFNGALYPGAKVTTDNPGEDLVPVKLGSESTLAVIQNAKLANYQRAESTTGLASVLEGRGDPTMKSGADASSVLALIAEGSKRFEDIDASIKEDYSVEFAFWMDLIQQFAPEGVFFKKVSEERAARLATMKYKPPRGRFSDTYLLSVKAPSAATNWTTQVQQLMVMNNLVTEFLTTIERWGMEIYAQENPVLVQGLKRQLFGFKTEIFRLLSKMQNLDSLVERIPKLRDPTPSELVIQDLAQKLQTLMQQLEMLQGQNAVLEQAMTLAQEGMPVEQAIQQAASAFEQQGAAEDAQAGQEAPQQGLPGTP